jgi:hypothetical protein
MAAAEEAREEAGVVGSVQAERIGSYTYRKSHLAGPIPVQVSVYLLEVREELASWPEGGQRERAWFTMSEAIARVNEPELRHLLQQVGKAWPRLSDPGRPSYYVYAPARHCGLDRRLAGYVSVFSAMLVLSRWIRSERSRKAISSGPDLLHRPLSSDEKYGQRADATCEST